MARGWESKSVQGQIEAAERRRADPAAVPKSADQLRREAERKSIEMTRTRVLHDLAGATHARHREQLEAALKHLDEKIAALKDPTDQV